MTKCKNCGHKIALFMVRIMNIGREKKEWLHIASTGQPKGKCWKAGCDCINPEPKEKPRGKR